MIVWALLFLSVLYACVFYFCICTCSAQLSMCHTEKRSRNALIIIIIIIIRLRGSKSVENKTLWSRYLSHFSTDQDET